MTPKSKRRFIWPMLLAGGLLVLALVILFGATQAYFSPERLKAELDKALISKSDEVRIEVDHMQLVLAGFLPRLAIEARNLRMEWLKDCRVPPVLLERALMRFSWRALLNGKLRLGPISVQHLQADFDENRCADKADPKPPSNVQPADRNAPIDRDVQSEATPPPPEKKKAVAEAHPLFTSLEVEKATVAWNGQQLVFERLSTSPFLPGKEVKIRSEVTWHLPGLTEYELPRFLVTLAVDRERLVFALNGKWKEGVINIDGDWYRSLGQRGVYQAKVRLENVPLSPISGVLNSYGLWRNPLGYKSVWFSCEAQISGDEKNKSGSIVTDACALSGELGKAKVPHLKLAFADNDLKRFSVQQAFEIELSAIDVEKILRVFQIDILGGVLKEYGRLQGVATVDIEGKSEFIGEISDVFIGFSRNRSRGQQAVAKAAGRFSIHERRISGQLDELVLKDGDFAGSLSFNFDRHFTEGHVQIGISKIQFSPGIQNLFFGGQTTPLSAFGKLTVKQNKVSHWEGELGFDQLKREDLQLDMIRVKSSFENQTLVLGARMQSGWLKTGSPFYRWLQPVLLGEKFEDGQVDLKELKTRFEIDRQSGGWTRGQMRIEPENIVLSSEGKWNEEGELKGWLNVDFPEFKMVKWDISGTSQNPVLSPNADNMRELARDRGKKKNPKK